MRGIDVSHHQLPDNFNWNGLKAAGIQFIIARASYGKNTADRQFKRFAELARAHGFVFGAYHFYRQVHSVEEQLALFNKQLESIGGLQPGDLFPALDMEDNRANGDGVPNPKIWNRACDEIGDGWKSRYGGAILYYSSYFPEQLNAHKGDKGWEWMRETGYFHWLADWGSPAGSPRTPYTAKWCIHQHRVSRIPEYSGGDVDQNHAETLSDILIPSKPVEPPSPQPRFREEDVQSLQHIGLLAQEIVDQVQSLLVDS